MNANLLIYISLIAAGFSLAFSIYALITATKARSWRKFFGKNANMPEPENVEDMLEQIVDKIKQLDGQATQTITTLESTIHQLNTATQHVGIIRYNGNGDDGGNLSFSLALLDAHQSGILITSLHGRQHNRIYAKLVTNGVSESTLSEEEREAVMQALTKPKNN